MLRLATLLENDAENKKGVKFDMGDWIVPDYDSVPDETNWKPKMSCDTIVCAWGAAALSGIFKKQGVTWDHSGTFMRIRYTGCNPNDVSNMESARVFFDISHLEVSYLFGGTYYPAGDRYRMGAAGERYVAKRLRNFVKKKLEGMKLINDDRDESEGDVRWVKESFAE